MSTEVFEYHLQVRDDATGPVAKVSAAAAAAGSVTSRFASGIASLNEGAKGMASKLGPAAAAISSVSASLGAAGGQAGKFVAAGGQVVAAFGAGGPVGAAIVAGTVAVDALSASWVKATGAQDAALESMFAGVNQQLAVTREAKDALEETRNALTAALRIGESEAVSFERTLESTRKAGAERVDQAQQRLEKLKGTAIDLKKVEDDAAKLDMTFQQARAWREDIRKKEIASAERALSVVKTEAMLAPVALSVAAKRAQAEDARAIAAERFKAAIEGQARAYQSMYRFREEEASTVGGFETGTDELSRTMQGKRAVEGGGLGSAIQDRLKAEAQERIESEAWVNKALSGADDRRMTRIKEISDKRIETAKETAAALLEVERQNAAAILDVGKTSLTTALSVGQDYLDAKIRGEENAEMKAVASFLSATGQQLVASGTRALFEGAILSSNPLTPGAGVPMMVAGGAAIGVGIGMGAAGSAVSYSAAGGIMGRALPTDAAKTERGPTSGSLGSGGTRTEAGTSLTIVYGGLSGPTADQGLRAFTRAQGMAAGRAGLVSRRQRLR